MMQDGVIRRMNSSTKTIVATFLAVYSWFLPGWFLTSSEAKAAVAKASVCNTAVSNIAVVKRGATQTTADAPNRTNNSTPNVVLLLVDDLGAHDIGATGSTFYRTPNIDRLASQSQHFRVAYATASVCSPSRGSLLTGLHPVDLNITDWIPGNRSGNRVLETPEDASELALKYLTFAELLKERGYRTFFAGKWHLGGKGFTPDQQGFDVYFDPHQQPEKGQPKNQRVRGDRPHATRVLTDEAIRFMSAEDQRPFLMMLSYYDVHTPIVPDEQFLPDFQQKLKQLPKLTPIAEHSGLTRPKQSSPAYASMVSAVDQSVGRIQNCLHDLDLEENTIVIFTSDNGGLSTLAKPGPTSNSPLRAGKGWLYEGGIRVPLLVKIPSLAGAEIDKPVWLMDLFPTIDQLCKTTKSIPLKFDSAIDLAQIWTQQSQGMSSETGLEQERELVWHYPHYHGSTWTPGAAIRLGNWKAIHFYESDNWELYDLSEDPFEQENVATKEAVKLRQLQNRLLEWQQKHQAKMPVRK